MSNIGRGTSAGQILSWDGSSWVPTAISGTISSTHGATFSGSFHVVGSSSTDIFDITVSDIDMFATSSARLSASNFYLTGNNGIYLQASSGTFALSSRCNNPTTSVANVISSSATVSTIFIGQRDKWLQIAFESACRIFRGLVVDSQSNFSVDQGGYFSVGGTPAESGDVRLSQGFSFKKREVDETFDLNIISSVASPKEKLNIGDHGGELGLSGSAIVFSISGSTFPNYSGSLNNNVFSGSLIVTHNTADGKLDVSVNSIDLFSTGSTILSSSALYLTGTTGIFIDAPSGSIYISGTIISIGSPTAITSSKLAATPTSSFYIINETTSSAGVPVQCTGLIGLKGTAFDTDDLISRTVETRMYCLPVSTTSVYGRLIVQQVIDNGAPFNIAIFDAAAGIGQLFINNIRSLRSDGTNVFVGDLSTSVSTYVEATTNIICRLGAITKLTINSTDCIVSNSLDVIGNKLDVSVNSIDLFSTGSTILSSSALYLTGTTGIFMNAPSGSIQMSASFYNVTGAVYFGNRNEAPPVHAGGGALYSIAGAGIWRGTSGTETTFGPAEPHCRRCGKDFAIVAKNEFQKWNHALCVFCLMKVLDRLGIARDDYMIFDEG